LAEAVAVAVAVAVEVAVAAAILLTESLLLAHVNGTAPGAPHEPP